MGFPGDSDRKEFACNEQDLGSVPVLGGSPGEGHGNPLKYSCLENPTERGAWQAMVHGVAKNLPAMQDTQVRFLGQEDPLEKGMAAYSSILAWRIPWTEASGRL